MAVPYFPPRYSEPGPGKKALIFYYDQRAGGYVYLPHELGARLAAAAAPATGGFERDDKIEVLVLKRIDMSEAEFKALPLVGEARVRRGGQ